MKLAKIELKDFRGFPGPETYTFDLAGGKNLLLYGENGSGKSSLFRALIEFFNLSATAAAFESHRNIFSSGGGPAATDGHVTLEMEDGSRHEWRCGGLRPHTDQAVPQTTRRPLVDAARRAAFLDYRAVLRTNFGATDIRTRLFDLAVNTVLGNAPATLPGQPEKTIAEYWGELLDSKPARHSQKQLERVAQAEVAFNQAFRLVLADVERLAAEFLAYFAGADLELGLNLPGVRYDGTPTASRDRDFVDRVLDFEVKLHGVALPAWNEFLNEARLSAMAISLYLAGAVLSNPVPPAGVRTPLRLLVLDDVLIGLDLTNRLPVLKILEERFSDYQVLLLTHDRVWFEMAHLALHNPDHWAMCELFTGTARSGPYVIETPVLKPQAGSLAKHFLTSAEWHLRSHDLRTAALHARAALEVKLKSYCSKHKVQVAFDVDPRRLNTDHFLDAIQRRLWWSGEMPRAIFAIKRVELFRGGVLNPLAHFHPVTLAPGEVAAAIEAVSALDFPTARDDAAQRTAQVLSRASLTPPLLIEAACWLRTTFEVDVRVLLKNHNGKVAYRDDWTKLTLAELWAAASDAMRNDNPGVAAALIQDVDNHRAIFLEEWRYDVVSRFTKAELDAAWNVLRDHSATPARTRLATFR